MKLLIYRISYLISEILLCLYGVGVLIYHLMLMSDPDTPYKGDVSIIFVGLGVGVIFVVFQILFISKSFKHGTMFIDQISFHHDDKNVNKITLTICPILFAIGLLLVIYFGLAALGVYPMFNEILTLNDALFYVFTGFLFVINAGFILLYIILFYRENRFLALK